MSSISVANLIVPKMPAQVENPVGKNAAISQQPVENEGLMSFDKAAGNQEPSSSKPEQKASFYDRLKERMDSDAPQENTENEQTETQPAVNKEVTNQQQPDESTDQDTQSINPPMLPALWFALQPVDISTNSAASYPNFKAVDNPQLILNQAVKTDSQAQTPPTNLPVQTTPLPQTEPTVQTVQAESAVQTVQANQAESTVLDDLTAKTEPAENSKPLVKQQVTAGSIVENAPKETVKGLSAAAPKEVQISPDTKAVSEIATVEKTDKDALSSEMTNNYVQKTTDSKILPADSSIDAAPKQSFNLTQVKTELSQNTESSELTNTPEAAIKELKANNKEFLLKTLDSHDVTETSISQTRSTGHIQQSIPQKINTETFATSTVTTTVSDKTSVQQPFLKPSEQLIEQIQGRITPTSQEIRVTLNPAELGSVRITFRQEDGQVEGLLEVQNPEVRKDVEKALPQIVAALSQSGMLIKRIDVAPMQNQQPNQDSTKSQEHDFNASDQQFLSEQGNQTATRGSGTGIHQEILSQEDMTEIRNSMNYDMSGLNMYA